MVDIALTVSICDRDDARPDPAATADVIVSVAEHHTVGELAAVLAAALGVDEQQQIALGSIQRVPGPDTPVTAINLCDGDVIGLGATALAGPERLFVHEDAGAALAGRRSVAVEVIGGPDAGRQIDVPPGVYAIDDHLGHLRSKPLTTRRPAFELSVGDELSVLVLPGDDRDVRVNGDLLVEPVALGAADVIRFREHRLVVRAPDRTTARWGGGPGQIDLYRTRGRRDTAVESHDFAPFGPIPAAHKPRRFGLIAVAAPLIAGIGMYLVTRQLMFLMMVALSPVMVVGGAVEDRRSGRRDARRARKEFDGLVAARRNEYIDARARERNARGQAAPDLVEIDRRAVEMTTALWERQRSSDGGVQVRLGLGATPTSFSVEVDSNGDNALRDQALATFEGLDTLVDAPIVVDLATDPVVAFVGAAADVDGLTAAVVCQLAVLFSPEDVLVAAAVSAARPVDWMKWMPHFRPQRRLIDSGHLARDSESGRRLVAAVQELVDRRIEEAGPNTEPPRWPRLVLILDANLELDRTAIDHLLDTGPHVGISVIWLASSGADVVRHAVRGVDLTRRQGRPQGRSWGADTSPIDLSPEFLTSEQAMRIARAVAPIRDAGSAGESGAIPASVTLWEVLGVDRPSPDWVARRWERAARVGLDGRFGWGLGGPVALDLVAEGPHTLIGGTSGAGKSELLQAIVAGLASQHPPDHLNFLFIDYKGGASTTVFERLPHTVGTVSNLDPALANRALRSLRAELDYRMRILDGRAKDLDDLARIDPHAPPRLVIIVDEFATLAKEIPEFVAGIIDIAQRGRSLGIHLVLATQRPAGSVNDNILANTNLRIALRCLDRADSSAIIDTADAAEIPTERRGRLMMRRGPRDLVEVQTGYGGAPAETTNVEPIRVGVFDRPDATARFVPKTSRPTIRPIEQPQDAAVTQLDVLIDAIATAGADMAPQRRPWREPLAEVVSIDEIARRYPDHLTGHGRRILGLADLPDEQSQLPAVIDFETSGGLMVFGSSASGKTQVLRSLAATVPTGPGGTTVVGFDGGSKGLAMLASLPWVAAVAGVEDIEAVTRWIVTVRDEIERRRQRGLRESDPQLLLLIDEWSSVLSALDESSPTGPVWSDRLQQLIVDGRSVRVHTVITADRRAALPTRLHAALGSRLVLRHADRSAYLDYGIGTELAKSLDLPSGRGIFDDTLIHVGVIGDDPSPDGQRSAIERRAATAGDVSPCISSRRLPDTVPFTSIAADEHGCVIGVADVDGDAVHVDLGRSPFVIVGGGGSGRSTALATIATAAAAGGWTVVLVGAADSGLDSIGPPDAPRGFDGSEIRRLCTTFADRAHDRVLFVIDDVDRLDDDSTTALAALVGSVSFAASADTRMLNGFSMSALIDEFRRSRRILVLQPGDASELMQLTGKRVDVRPGVAMVPGRGVLLDDRAPTIMHVALPRSPVTATAENR